MMEKNMSPLSFRAVPALLLAVSLASAGCEKSQGPMSVKYDTEETTFKVGTVHAIASKWEDGSKYTFVVYNEGVKNPPCSDKLDYDKAVGGDNWALLFEMSPIGNPVKPTDKERAFPGFGTHLSYVASKGDYKGSHFTRTTTMGVKEGTITIVSIDGDTIKARVDADRKEDGTSIHGTFTAKVCVPKG
jgi:hypothetical protein